MNEFDLYVLANIDTDTMASPMKKATIFLSYIKGELVQDWTKRWVQWMLRQYQLCHKTTARAARLEQGFLVTLVRLVSNVRVSQGSQHDSLVSFATLPRKKGQMDCVRAEAWWNCEKIKVFHLIGMMLRRPHKVVCRGESGVV